MGAFIRSFFKTGTDLLEKNDVIDHNGSAQDDVHGHEIEKQVEVARNAPSELFEVLGDIPHEPEGVVILLNPLAAWAALPIGTVDSRFYASVVQLR